MPCLTIWKVLRCSELALKAIILVLAGERKRPRSLALDAVELRKVCICLADLGPYEIMAMTSAYVRMSTHGDNDMEIRTVIKALNNVGEPCGGACSEWVWIGFYPLKSDLDFSIV